MLIDTNSLDPSKSYVCLEVGTSRIAKVLQKLQHKKFPEYKPENIASHAFALIYRGNGWDVWENHLCWGGIKEYTLEDYEKLNAESSAKKVIIHEYPLNIDAMDYWRENNPGYSVTNLFAVAGERLVGLKLPDTKGWICSQAVSAACLGVPLKLGLQFDDVCPIDLQRFFDKKQ